MGLAGRSPSGTKSPGAGGGAGQLVGVALLLLLVYWIADVALDAFFTGEHVFPRFILAPPPHELADRFLALLLTCCFLRYSSRVSKVRGALERALQEALLKAENERAKVVAIVEAMGDAISIQDPQLNVLYQNRAHRELRGSHVGERCYEAYRHKSEVCSGCHLVEAFSDGAAHRVEIEAQRGERMLCLEVIASPLRDPQGGIMAGIEVMRDITDRKLAEQAARKEAALLQHLIDTIPSPIYHQDPSGRFLWCNTAFAAWLAKPRELIVGRTLAEVAPVQLCQIFAEDEPGPCRGTVREASWLRGDGVACDVIFYKSMFIDDAGQSGGVVGVMIDIAQRKRAEAKVIGLNAALTRQACELHQANRELEAFSHAISHDLRSPLTRIYSSGQALQEYGDQLDENGAFFVQSINDGCVQIDLLLDSLMVLSRVTEMELVTDQVDLSSLARDLASELQRSEPGRPVSFLIAQALRVQGDPQLLHLALENLIGNAWKYTSGVSLPRIEFGSQLSAEGETVFFLKDNGAGFDGARSDQLFKPFRRLHTSQEFPGTGLGLATVRRIIRRHNGRVWAEGKPGCGATFYFTVNG